MVVKSSLKLQKRIFKPQFNEPLLPNYFRQQIIAGHFFCLTKTQLAYKGAAKSGKNNHFFSETL